MLARRKECGTGQDADIFFHSASSKPHIAVIEELEQGSFLSGLGMFLRVRCLMHVYLQRRLVREAMRFRYRLTSQLAIPSVDPTDQRRLFFAGALEAKIGK